MWSDTNMSDQTLIINARDEYIAQLADAISTTVFEFVDGAYQTAIMEAGRQNRFRDFQYRLRNVQFWNSAQISSTVNRILGTAPYLSDLIGATIVAQVKVLSSIKMTDNKHSIRLKLPSTDAFVHRVFINLAHILYDSPRLWPSASAFERVEILKRAIFRAVRDVLPTSDILRSYLGGSVAADGTLTPFSGDEGAAAPAAEPAPRAAATEDDGAESDDDDGGDDDEDDEDGFGGTAAGGGGGGGVAQAPVQAHTHQPAPAVAGGGGGGASDMTATEILRSVQVEPAKQPEQPAGGGQQSQPQHIGGTAIPPTVPEDFGGSDDW